MDVDDDSTGLEAARVVCRAFLSSAPVDGAAFTQMDSDEVRNTWFASDEDVEELERVQYALGEGPTGEAFRSGRAVLVADLRSPSSAVRWPMLAQKTGHLPVSGLFAIPMQLGAINIGICLAYRHRPGLLPARDLHDLLRAVDSATLALLAVRAGTAQSALDHRPIAPTIHQATGMVVAQLRSSAEEAFARIRAHAYVTGRSLEEVADDIVRRRLRLEADPPTSEPPPTSRSNR